MKLAKAFFKVTVDSSRPLGHEYGDVICLFVCFVGIFQFHHRGLSPNLIPATESKGVNLKRGRGQTRSHV